MLHIRNHDGYTNPAKDVDYMAEQYFLIRFSESIRSATDSTNKQNYGRSGAIFFFALETY